MNGGGLIDMVDPEFTDEQGRPRIVITGYSIIAPHGFNEDAWNAVLKGESAIKTFEKLHEEGLLDLDPAEMKTALGKDIKLKSTIAALVPKLNPEDYLLSSKEYSRMDITHALTLAAEHDALVNAGFKLEIKNKAGEGNRKTPQYDVVPENTGVVFDPKRMGNIVGVGLGGTDTFEASVTKFLKTGRSQPRVITGIMPQAGAGDDRYLINSASGSDGAACAGGGKGFASTVCYLSRGIADIILLGAADSIVPPGTFMPYSAFDNSGTMVNYEKIKDDPRFSDPTKCPRPFDAERMGFIMRNGASAVVVETLEHAIKRGAEDKIIGEVFGVGGGTDRFDSTTPDPEAIGLRVAYETALRDANLSPEQIAEEAYVSYHGTGTEYNEIVETVGTKAIFGDKIIGSATKSTTGHGISATSLDEIIYCCLAIRDGILPPTMNLDTPGSEYHDEKLGMHAVMDLDCIPNKAMEKQVRFGVSNACGFGGHNYVTIVGEYKR